MERSVSRPALPSDGFTFPEADMRSGACVISTQTVPAVTVATLMLVPPMAVICFRQRLIADASLARSLAAPLAKSLDRSEYRSRDAFRLFW